MGQGFRFTVVDFGPDLFPGQIYCPRFLRSPQRQNLKTLHPAARTSTKLHLLGGSGGLSK